MGEVRSIEKISVLTYVTVPGVRKTKKQCYKPQVSSFSASENNLTDQKLYEYISKEHVIPQLLIVEYSTQQY